MPKRLAWVTRGGFLLAAFGCMLETLVPEVATGTCSSLRGWPHKGAIELSLETSAGLPSAAAWQSSPGLLLLRCSSPQLNDFLSPRAFCEPHRVLALAGRPTWGWWSRCPLALTPTALSSAGQAVTGTWWFSECPLSGATWAETRTVPGDHAEELSFCLVAVFGK